MTTPPLQPASRGRLYLVVCAAPPAADVGELVTLARDEGWEVRVLATPDAVAFIDRDELTLRSGFPVRSAWRTPETDPPLPDLDPTRDVVVVAPATFTTVNKLAAGIADNLAVGLVCEAVGAGVPVVVAPNVKQVLAGHPQFPSSLANLLGWGVHVIEQLPIPRGRRIPPWPLVLAEVQDASTHRPSAPLRSEPPRR